MFGIIWCMAFMASGQSNASSADKAYNMFEIQLKEGTKALPQGSYSLSICNAETVDSSTRQTNAEVELLLKSELRGKIEKPYYYFENPTPVTDSNLDLLLMTQGWRRYDLDTMIHKQYPNIRYSFETEQTIAGHVETVFNKKPKNMRIFLLSPFQGTKNEFVLGENNHFIIKNLNFVDGTPFTLESTTKDGEREYVRLYVEEPQYPKLDLRSFAEQEYDIAEDSNIRKDKFTRSRKKSSLFDMNEIPEVEISAKKKDIKWMNKAGLDPAQILSEKDLQSTHFSTMNAILGRLGITIKGNAQTGMYFGRYLPTLSGGNSFIKTKIFIDNLSSEQDELFDMRPSQIERIEYFTPNDPRLLVYGNDAVIAGCLFVYQKYDFEMKENAWIKHICPLGYKPAMHFYSPTYTPDDSYKYDFRTTLYWNPNVTFDSRGCIRVKVSNLNSSSYQITVEGLTEDGRIISKNITIH